MSEPASHSNADKERERMMEEKRKKSRVDYLTKRAPKVLHILEEDLRDEKLLFADANLTKEEKRRLEKQEKLLDITKKHIEVGEKARTRQYFLNDNRDNEFIQSDDEDDNNVNKERKLWEKTKIDDANFAKSKRNDDTTSDRLRQDLISDFELLLDDVEFIKIVRSEDNFDKYLIDSRKADRIKKERARLEMQEMRRKLPVYEHRSDLLQAIAENQIVIVQGETGCGKTTQLPQYLHEEGYTKTEMKDQELKMVGCTQPRRVAAMSVAARVSQEVGSKLGHTVGYSIRFEDRTSEATVIKYMTDGMLLREFLDDPMLSKYSVMIVDEAHERTIHTDILLSLLKDVSRARPDFRLVISSATLDEKKFSNYFNNPPLFKIKGRLYNVDNRFMKETQDDPFSNITDACLRTVIHIHRTGQPGDILVFLPGQDDIEELQRDLETYVKHEGSKIKELLIRPIYANLPTDQQSRVFDKTPQGARKVVIATNIAETSITIDGIVFVVDSGFCKQNKFSPQTCMETLAITRISKASADQRSGRAGRNRPGICYRLYTKEEFANEFESNTDPEILRLNLANVVLLLKTMRINDVMNFEYVDKPPMDMLIHAVEQLTALGALEVNGELTPLGRKMAEFPVDPKMSKSIVSSESYGCSEQVLSIMSMLSINGTIFFKPKDKQKIHAEAARKSFFSSTGDHLMMLKVYDDWAATGFNKQWCFEKFIQYKSLCRARDVREQLEKLCDKVELKLLSNLEDTDCIRKAILCGFFHNVARVSREGGSYRTIRKNQPVYIHPTSALFDTPVRWVVFNEIKQTTKEYLRIVTEIEPNWLTQVAPNFYNIEEVEELSKRKMPKFNMGKTKAQLNPKRSR